jgi:hypothetical protein
MSEKTLILCLMPYTANLPPKLLLYQGEGKNLSLSRREVTKGLTEINWGEPAPTA